MLIADILTAHRLTRSDFRLNLLLIKVQRCIAEIDTQVLLKNPLNPLNLFIVESIFLLDYFSLVDYSRYSLGVVRKYMLENTF